MSDENYTAKLSRNCDIHKEYTCLGPRKSQLLPMLTSLYPEFSVHSLLIGFHRHYWYLLDPESKLKASSEKFKLKANKESVLKVWSSSRNLLNGMFYFEIIITKVEV